jgi:hypothetical protein
LKHLEEFCPGGEGQQQTLRVYFGGIYSNVRDLLIGQIDNRYRKTPDPMLKAEIDRLTERNTLLERREFVEKRA